MEGGHARDGSRFRPQSEPCATPPDSPPPQRIITVTTPVGLYYIQHQKTLQSLGCTNTVAIVAVFRQSKCLTPVIGEGGGVANGVEH